MSKKWPPAQTRESYSYFFIGRDAQGKVDVNINVIGGVVNTDTVKDVRRKYIEDL